MKNWWTKFNSLSKEEKLAVPTIFCLLLLFKILIVLFSFKNIKKIYAYLSKKKKSTQNPTIRYTYLINGIAHHARLGFTCLPQALTYKFIFSKDKEAKIILGVNNTNGKFEAHAWVEKNGVKLIGDTPLIKFVPIWEWS